MAAARRLTSAGDVSGFWLTDDGVVFSALREKRDRERAEAGEPLTVLNILPYDGGEARELCRLGPEPLRQSSSWVGDRFIFTASAPREWDAALKEAGRVTKRPPSC